MQRNWDTMRSVLLEVEALTREQATTFVYRAPWGSDDPEAIRAVHALMLQEYGYLKGSRSEYFSEGQVLLKPELTMLGADLLDSIREQRMWDKLKGIAAERGVGLAFEYLPGLAKAAYSALMA